MITASLDLEKSELNKIGVLHGMMVYEISKHKSKEIDDFLSKYMTKKWYIPNFIYRKIYKLEIQNTKLFGTYIYRIYKFGKLLAKKKITY